MILWHWFYYMMMFIKHGLLGFKVCVTWRMCSIQRERSEPAASWDEELVILLPGAIIQLHHLIDWVHWHHLQLKACLWTADVTWILYIANIPLCSSPPFSSTPQFHTADKSQLSGAGCCCCPDWGPEKRQGPFWNQAVDNSFPLLADWCLTLLSLGLSNGGRLSLVTMMIRPS